MGCCVLAALTGGDMLYRPVSKPVLRKSPKPAAQTHIDQVCLRRTPRMLCARCIPEPSMLPSSPDDRQRLSLYQLMRWRAHATVQSTVWADYVQRPFTA